MLFDYNSLRANFYVNINYRILFDYQDQVLFDYHPSGKHVTYHSDTKLTGNHCTLYQKIFKKADGTYRLVTFRSTGEVLH